MLESLTRQVDGFAGTESRDMEMVGVTQLLPVSARVESVSIPVLSSPRIEDECPGLTSWDQVLQRYARVAECDDSDARKWIVCSKKPLRTYDPMHVAGLYRRFLDIGVDRDRALDFARKFGTGNRLAEGPGAAGEPECWLPLAMFFYDVWRLRVVHDLHLAVERKDWPFIRSLSDRVDEAIALGVTKVPIVDSEQSEDKERPCVSFTDPEEVARCQLSYLMTQNFGAPNSIIIARYRPGRGFELVTLAQGLLAAMTAQLYEAIQRGKGYGECPECGRCFIRERANQVYCGKTCGDRWRKRKERYGGHRTAQSAA